MGYCCVPNCRSSQSKGVSFHKFPTCIESKRLWIIAISQRGKLQDYHWTPKGRSTVCSKHFTDSDYSVSTTKKILLPNAVPSVFEDLVSHKNAKRMKSVQSNKDACRNRIKGVLPNCQTDIPEENSKKELVRLRKGKRVIKQSSVVPEMKNRSKNNETTNTKIRKSVRRTISSPVRMKKKAEKETPTLTDETSEIVTVPVEVPTESTAMLVEEDISDCATLPLSEELSDTDWDQSENSIQCTPQNNTIKISKNLQLVLRKLVTTIENQRSEILKLKKERDLLAQELFNLKKKQIQQDYIKKEG